MEWFVAAAKQTGRVHSDPEEGQDAFGYLHLRDGDVLVAAISDGAGSAEHGAVGSERGVAAFLQAGKEFIEAGLNPLAASHEECADLFGAVHRSLIAHAGKAEIPLPEMSATLVASIITPDGGLFLQVGDGAAVFASGDTLALPHFPADGEFVNITQFITNPEWRENLILTRHRGPIEDVFLFSDGLQYLLIDFKDHVPHAPFFARLRQMMRDPAATQELLEGWMNQMLASDQVTSRSDDDTCLLMAHRRAKIGDGAK